MYLQALDNLPIIACSTSLASNAAIGIIRISGFDDVKVFNKVLQRPIKTFKKNYFYHNQIISGSEILDDVLIVYFKTPKSFTGENLIEFHVHGNILNINRIIEYFINVFKFRRASAGEFSLRALRNNKLSLSQVEGLDLLLNATSTFHLNQGNSFLYGELFNEYKNLHRFFINHKSSLELGIDFLDDVGEEQFNINLNETFNQFFILIEKLFSQSKYDISELKYPKIVLFGKTNAGKSSLFNNLLSFDRAIVSEIEGTTRDYISENINFKNVGYQLVDTAGIRETDDKIELKGLERLYKLLQNSFFKILVLHPDDDLKNYTKFSFDLIIYTHGKKSGPIEPVSPYIVVDNFNFSENSKLSILEFVNKKYLSLVKDNPISIERHSVVISNIYNLILPYKDMLSTENDIALISQELNLIGNLIEELIGIVTPDEVLNNIFSNFCIGK